MLAYCVELVATFGSYDGGGRKLESNEGGNICGLATGGCENKASLKAGGGSTEEFITGGAQKFCGGSVFAIIILSKLGGFVKEGGMVCSLASDGIESKSNEGGAIG